MINPHGFDDEPTVTASTATRPRFFGRKSTAASGLAVAKGEISDMAKTLTEVAERMAALDAADTSPAAVRRATLNDVVDRLRAAGDYAGCTTVQRMIQEEAN